MGDEFEPASMRFGTMCDGKVEWDNYGFVSPDGIQLSADSIEASELPDLRDFKPVPMHVKLEVQWWQLCKLRRLLGFRPTYTVRRLRRGGKSHKGKEVRWM